MCTAIAKKGNDLLYGFNLDINPNVWDFDIYKTKNYFSVGIKVGSRVYCTHGVNSSGNFSNVPYMNGDVFAAPRGAERERIDLLTDKYIRGKYQYDDVAEIIKEKVIVNIPAATMHSLLCDRSGHFLIIEPGYGVKQVETDFAVLTNFPVSASITDFSNPFYGKDRYDTAYSILQNSDDGFSVRDALDLLDRVKQNGRWGTRISFVYSGNENAVYYFTDGDLSTLKAHKFNV